MLEKDREVLHKIDVEEYIDGYVNGKIFGVTYKDLLKLLTLAVKGEWHGFGLGHPFRVQVRRFMIDENGQDVRVQLAIEENKNEN